MPDKTLLIQVMVFAAGVAFVLAAEALFVFGWLWRAAAAGWRSLGGAVAVGVSLLAGAFALRLQPEWPPVEDQHRYLLLLLPAAVAVASLAAFLDRRWWAAWLLRLLLAVAAARILLHHTIYLEDQEPPAQREWTPTQTAFILGGLAAGLLAVWAALDLFVRRTRGSTVGLALGITSAGAAAAVMYSGYASGGQLGIPLAGAMLGVATATFLFGGSVRETGSAGVGVVGLFGLLILGRFFGSLTTAHALLLFLAPLLCWIPELPRVRRLWRWVRGLLAVALVVIPVALIVNQAEQHARELEGPAPQPGEATSQDYEQFGK